MHPKWAVLQAGSRQEAGGQHSALTAEPRAHSGHPSSAALGRPRGNRKATLPGPHGSGHCTSAGVTSNLAGHMEM